MKKQIITSSLFVISIASFFLFASCNSNEDLLAPKLEKNIFIELEKIGMEGKSWKELDKFYRKEVHKYANDELINRTILLLSNERLKFFETADIKTFEYYLGEAENVQFNRNLRLVVQMLYKIEPYWGTDKVANYAQKMYDKNLAFWNSNFTGNSIYLDKNAEAINALLALQNDHK